jgi:hypothetical protein
VTVPARRLLITALLPVLAVSACRPGARPAPMVEDTALAASPSERLALIAKKCARIASCAHPHDPPQWRNPSACVDFWLARAADPDLELPACLSSALTCDAVVACLHPSHRGASAAFCRARPGAMTGCDGTNLVSCGVDDPEESTVLDCASLGAKCGDVVQAGGLSTHACVDPVRCPAELNKAWCNGALAVLSCHDGEIERTACKPGSTCQEHADADGEHFAMCEVPGHASCTTPGGKRCDGSRLVECEAHGHFGHEHTVDCAAEGLSCSLSDAGETCTNASPQCQGGHPSCEGNALVFCASGTHVRVDCAEIGLGPCEADGRGPDATCRSVSGREAR